MAGAAERIEPGLRPVAHPDGDGPVQQNGRCRSRGDQLVVEPDDAGPVRLRGRRRHGVGGRDERLHLVRPDPLPAQGSLHMGQSGRYEVGVPPRPVLLLQRDQLAVRPDPGGRPRMRQFQ
jgi:hypothetical protein